MSHIKVLDQNLANMIAAGEVIERPSSVIKELIENSLDAKATAIDIHIYEAGRSKIIVNDNGQGMDEEDAKLAFLRHATSKIKDEFDLFHINTLGFRGEALPSIASVSQVELISASSLMGGLKVTIDNGQISYEKTSSNIGTLISVSELFYNTPARLKYLKSDNIENASSIEIVSKLAIGHPHVAFSLTIDDRLIFKTSGQSDQHQAIYQIYGDIIAKNLIYFTHQTPDFKISGYLGTPIIAKSNRYYMLTLLNGRNVYMGKIVSAIIEAYGPYLPANRYPFAVFNFDIEPALLDVNVHPSKREVRFSKETELKEALIKVISATLAKQSLTGAPIIKQPSSYPLDQINETNDLLTLSEDAPTEQLTINEQIFTRDTYFKAIGQLHETYIVASNDRGGFLLIDQHAAAERINFEKYMHLAKTATFTRAPLIPIVIEINQSDARLLNEQHFQHLQVVGILLEPFGPRQYRVMEVPLWAEGNEQAYVEQLLDQILHEDKLDVSKLLKDAIASKSCKRSLKAHQTLSISEMQQLLDDLLKCQQMYHCPHGRPTIIEFSQYELEKMFKRTGF